MSHPEGALHEQGQMRVRSYSLVFALSFMVFLAIAVVGALLGCQWRTWLPGAEGVKSLPGGVKAAVYTFMSNLT